MTKPKTRNKRASKRNSKPRNATKASASAILAQAYDDPPPAELEPRQLRFVEEYLVDLNATQAAIRSGYSAHTAKSIGHENLCKPPIQYAIAKAMSERAKRTRRTADRVLTEVEDLAYTDIIDAYNPDGTLKQLADMPPHIRRAIARIETDEIKLGKDGPVIGHTKRVWLYDKKGSLELLGRHLKLFTDRVEHSASASLEDILTRSRETT